MFSIGILIVYYFPLCSELNDIAHIKKKLTFKLYIKYKASVWLYIPFSKCLSLFLFVKHHGPFIVDVLFLL